MSPLGMGIAVVCAGAVGALVGREVTVSLFRPKLVSLTDIKMNRPGWLLRRRDVDLIREVATDHADLTHIEDLLELGDRMLKMIPPEVP